MDLTPSIVEVTIAADAALSDAADFQASRLTRVIFPADWTEAAATFQVSEDGETWFDLFVETAEYSLTSAAADRAVAVNPAIFYDVRRLKVRSGTAAVPVDQAAQRTIKLVLDDQ